MLRQSKAERDAVKADTRAASRFLILTPVLDDWGCLVRLLGLLDTEFGQASLEADVLIVDDGSQTEPPAGLARLPLVAIKRVMLLRLARNVGHQRAIAIALPFVRAHLPHRAVVVMDCDGEDRPADAVRLVEEHLARADRSAIFAVRSTRSEGRVFRLFYRLYRLTFRLLVGRDVRIGNFSLLPRPLLPRLVRVSELWNHYSAGLVRSRLPWVGVPCPRGSRLAGRSRMNLVSLVTHGLNAIAVNGDVVGARALLFFGGLTLASVVLALATLAVRFATDWAIPGWATNAFGLASVLLLQSVTLSTFFVFLILGARNNQTFLPVRDYPYYLYEFRTLYAAVRVGRVAPTPATERG
jgi:hypothetical protein